MMSMLVVGPAEREKIKEIVEHAHASPLSLQDIKDTIAGKKKAIGTSSPENVLHLFEGVRVVYSEEYQPKGLYRHLSVSVARDKRYPNPAACGMILQEFGFRHAPMNPSDWLKPDGSFVGWIDEENQALNFLEKYEE